MLKEGICVFSGHDIKKGSGLTKVTNDTRSFLFKNNKVLALVSRKANPRDIPWTQASRIFNKKGDKKMEKKETRIKVVKEVRGYPGVSKQVVEEQEKKFKSRKVFKETKPTSKVDTRKRYY